MFKDPLERAYIRARHKWDKIAKRFVTDKKTEALILELVINLAYSHLFVLKESRCM